MDGEAANKPGTDEAATRQGFEINRISEDVFRDFAEQHGTSPEIGRIGTILDPDADRAKAGDIHLLGLFGCGKLCAVCCCTVALAKVGGSHACKLDSVIADDSLRRRGLAGVLVANAFLELLDDPGLNVTTFYAHSVHPGTVALLQRLAFRDPPPVGAPISSIHIGDGGRDAFVANCRDRFNTVSGRLKLHCARCLVNRRRATPWCLPRKD